MKIADGLFGSAVWSFKNANLTSVVVPTLLSDSVTVEGVVKGSALSVRANPKMSVSRPRANAAIASAEVLVLTINVVVEVRPRVSLLTKGLSGERRNRSGIAPR